VSYESLIYEKLEGVGIVTLNRPAADNAINSMLAAEMDDVCTSIIQTQDIKVMIITGTGEMAFATGVGYEELISPSGGNNELVQLSIATKVAGLPCPIIAAVNGDALGQGLEVALACDLRIAVETAYFALPHIAEGIISWDGATQRLPRLIGASKAIELLLTGQAVDATEAHRIGLVNRVVKRAELMPLVMEIGQTMASKAPFALKYVKEAIVKGLDLTLEQGLRLEADLYCLLQTTEDRAEGIRAYLEKRPPQFKNR